MITMVTDTPAVTSLGRKRQQPIQVLLTPVGWVTVLATPAFAATAFWQDHPTGVYIALALAGALLCSHFWSRAVVQPLSARWLLPQATHCFEPCTVGCLISSPLARGPFAVAVSERGEAGHLAHISGCGPANTRCVWNTRFTQRGLQRLPRLELRCSRPFGLLMARKRLPARPDLLVLPALGQLRPEALREVLSWLDAGFLARDPGADEVAHLRPYRPGDSMRTIHWRATAKTREIMVTERHAPRARQITIVIDNQLRPGRSQRFERLICAAATLIQYFCQHSWEVRLAGPWIAGGGMVGGQTVLLESLALVQHDPAAQVSTTIPRHEPCLVFTVNRDFQAPEGSLSQVIHVSRAEKLVRMGRHIR